MIETTTEGYRDYQTDATDEKRYMAAITRGAMENLRESLARIERLGGPHVKLPSSLLEWADSTCREGLATCQK